MVDRQTEFLFKGYAPRLTILLTAKDQSKVVKKFLVNKFLLAENVVKGLAQDKFGPI